jgi:hypothetical protein
MEPAYFLSAQRAASAAAAHDRTSRRPLQADVGPMLGRPMAVRYTGVVTQVLEAALAALAKLPPEEQDRVGRWLLEELRDEEQWDRRFRGSQDALSKLGAEALADHAAGRTTPLDPEQL